MSSLTPGRVIALVVYAALAGATASGALANPARTAPFTVAENDEEDSEPSGRDSPSSGSFSIQFGYAVTKPEADHLKQKTASRLGLPEKELAIRPTINSANPTYLIVYGQFPSRSEGRTRCRQLKLTEDTCWVINNVSK
jgi:hypothetical protein